MPIWDKDCQNRKNPVIAKIERLREGATYRSASISASAKVGSAILVRGPGIPYVVVTHAVITPSDYTDRFFGFLNLRDKRLVGI